MLQPDVVEGYRQMARDQHPELEFDADAAVRMAADGGAFVQLPQRNFSSWLFVDATIEPKDTGLRALVFESGPDDGGWVTYKSSCGHKMWAFKQGNPIPSMRHCSECGGTPGS